MTDAEQEPVNSELSHLAHDRLIAAMRVVESLPPSARGALLVGPQDEPLGTILIENNRVCWGAASGMSGRLRDILRSHCQVSIRDDELDAVYDRCRRESRPISDVLEVSGLVTPDHMRAALKQHTIESLLAVDAAVAILCGGDALTWPMQWIEHGGRGYNPRYTFGAVEVLAAAGAQRLQESDAKCMIDHLDELADPSSALVAFSFEPDGTPIYVGATTWLPIDLQDLLALTTWAEAALGASSGFSAAVARACVESSDGAAVAWRFHGRRCAALCTTGASLRRLAKLLDDRGIAIVLATKPLVLVRVRERVEAKKQGE
ncbi:MAG: hypothetical protein ABW321_10025 [Polyangiales bacterium]